MTREVAHDMTWSSALFCEQVWPLMRDKVGGGEIMQMEGRPDMELAKTLDMRAGIDSWHVMQSGGIRGIASRIQAGDKVWASFTVRHSRDNGAETEYQKRLDAIKKNNGQLFPYLTVQAYARTTNGPIMAVGICITADLFRYITDGHAKLNRTNNASFFVCYWDDMKRRGYRVKKTLTPDSESARLTVSQP
jgi:hypothetical protein